MLLWLARWLGMGAGGAVAEPPGRTATLTGTAAHARTAATGSASHSSPSVSGSASHAAVALTGTGDDADELTGTAEPEPVPLTGSGRAADALTGSASPPSAVGGSGLHAARTLAGSGAHQETVLSGSAAHGTLSATGTATHAIQAITGSGQGQGDAMAVEKELSCFRGEKLTITWTSTDSGLDIQGRATFVFRLLQSRGGSILATLNNAAGITITGAKAATIVVPGTATDLPPGTYYYSISDTAVPVVYTHGDFKIDPPSAS